VLTATGDRTVKGIGRLKTVAHVGDAEVAAAELMLFPDAENASPLELA
jgi:hypothetical protein